MIYTVYVKPDSQGRITAIGSDAFLSSFDGWVEIDRGEGDRYHHAQNNYLPRPIRDERGVCRYRLADGQIQERSREEMDGDFRPVPTAAQRIAALEEENHRLTARVEALVEQNSFHEDLIAELAGIVYA